MLGAVFRLDKSIYSQALGYKIGIHES